MVNSGGPWRVFLSHTSELQDFPRGGSYVDAAGKAVNACGHVVGDMSSFPAADLPAAKLCADRVRSCDVYVGILGTRYGSPVRDKPEVSYTELEYETATEAGLTRLVFLLSTDAEYAGIPLHKVIDREYGARQDAFRQRVLDAGLVVQTFTDPSKLGQLVERSLHALAAEPPHATDRSREAVVVAGEIPQEPLGFQPRTDLLAALDAPDPVVRPVRTLTGMRGVGKTQLAAAYARAKLAARWRLVAWINAEDEGVLLTGLADAASALGLTPGDARLAGRALRRRLEADGEQSLLVFDNAADPVMLQPFLPAAGSARVIITSNNQEVAGLGPGVPVDVFTEDEALTFMAARIGMHDPGGARALAAELGWLPLALAQAAAVLAAQRLPYGTYLERLRRLPAAGLLKAEVGQYPRGVAAAVLVSLENVRGSEQGEACEAIMNLLAVLSAAGVRRTLIHSAADQGLPSGSALLPSLTPETADSLLGRLASVSLLTFSLDGNVITVYRLVMRVIREQLAATGSLSAVCGAAALLLDSHLEPLAQHWHEDRVVAGDLVEQVMALTESAARIPSPDDLALQLLYLRGRALWLLNELGDSTERAVMIGEQLLRDQEQLLGEDHPDTVTARHDLANAYRAAGRNHEAIGLHEKVLAARERILGTDDPSTLTSRNELANDYAAARRNDEAISLHEQTLAARARILGAGHPDTLTSRNNLASVYWAEDRTDDAIPLLEQILAAREQALGSGHPDTQTSRNNLANAYRGAGRTDEAITLHEQTLAAREEDLGLDHPSTLRSRSNLASAYMDASRTEEAIGLYEQTLAARRRILGSGHPDTLTSSNNLANAYRTAGRGDEAIPLHEQALAGRSLILGPEHPDTLQSRRNLAAAYRDAGRDGEARDLEG